MHDRLGQQIVETPLVAALGGRIVDLEQRFGFGAADRLMFDCGRGQDARAPGGIIGVQRPGKVNAAFGGGAFARDHAVAHNRQGKGRGVAAGNLRWFEGADSLGDLRRRGRHWYSFQFLVLVQHFHAGVNEWLTIRNSLGGFFNCCWLVVVTSVTVQGFATRSGSDAASEGQYQGNRALAAVVVFPLYGRISKEHASSSAQRKSIYPFAGSGSLEGPRPLY